jgi:voltage-gated potassium channel
MARSRTRDLRRRVYQVLEQGPVGDGVGTWVDRALVTLIVINLVAVALKSMPKYASSYAAAFDWIEYVSLAVFTIEYALRLWVAVEHGPYRHLSHMRAP